MRAATGLDGLDASWREGMVASEELGVLAKDEGSIESASHIPDSREIIIKQRRLEIDLPSEDVVRHSCDTILITKSLAEREHQSSFSRTNWAAELSLLSHKM